VGTRGREIYALAREGPSRDADGGNREQRVQCRRWLGKLISRTARRMRCSHKRMGARNEFCYSLGPPP